jgi:hypothetical protein
LTALERIYSFLFTKGRDDEASVYLKRVEEFYEVVELAEKERATVSDQDRLKLHDLPPETVEKIRTTLSYHEEITAAYLVQKDVRYFPEKPCYVLGIKTRKRWFWSTSSVKDADLVATIADRVAEQGIHYILALNEFKSLEKQMNDIPHSLIYQS